MFVCPIPVLHQVDQIGVVGLKRREQERLASLDKAILVGLC